MRDRMTEDWQAANPAAVERWLREEIAKAYDTMQAAPGRALAAEAVFDEIRARLAARLREGV